MEDRRSSSEVSSTIFVQALAAVLIANSHLEELYPQRWMAADGLLGNSMFFLLSGYGLMRSEQKHSRRFLKYYLRRVLRIYPSLLLTVLVFQVLGQGTWRYWTWTDYLKNLAYPTAYGYIQQVMLFYVVFFFLARLRQSGIFLWLAAALCLPYAWFFLTDVSSGRTGSLTLGSLNPWMWWIFFFQVMLLGGWLASREPGGNLVMFKHPWLVLGLCFGAYVAFKFAMVKGVRTPAGLLFNFYFVLHLLTVVLIILTFALTTMPEFSAALGKIRPLFWIVSIVGGLTLEIYVVHVFVFSNPQVAHIVFPLNVLVFFIITIGLSWGIARIASVLRRTIDTRA